MHNSKKTKIFLIVSLFTSVVFASIVSFHDYLPEHPPAYLLLAEDKLKLQYMAGHVLKDLHIYTLLNNICATCDSAQVAPSVNASLICILISGSIQKYKRFLSLLTDLPPPAA